MQQPVGHEAKFAAVHSSLWPEDHNERGILNVAVLAGGRALVQIAQTDKGVSE